MWLVLQVFGDKPKYWKLKILKDTKGFIIYLLGEMHLCANFHENPFSSCQDLWLIKKKSS